VSCLEPHQLPGPENDDGFNNADEGGEEQTSNVASQTPRGKQCKLFQLFKNYCIYLSRNPHVETTIAFVLVHNLDKPVNAMLQADLDNMTRDQENELLGEIDHGAEAVETVNQHVSVLGSGKQVARKPAGLNQNNKEEDEDDDDDEDDDENENVVIGRLRHQKYSLQSKVKRLKRAGKVVRQLEEDSDDSSAVATAEVVGIEEYPAGLGPYGNYGPLEEMLELDMAEVEVDPDYKPWLQTQFHPIKKDKIKFVDEFRNNADNVETFGKIERKKDSERYTIADYHSHRYGDFKSVWAQGTKNNPFHRMCMMLDDELDWIDPVNVREIHLKQLNVTMKFLDYVRLDENNNKKLDHDGLVKKHAKATYLPGVDCALFEEFVRMDECYVIKSPLLRDSPIMFERIVKNAAEALRRDQNVVKADYETSKMLGFFYYTEAATTTFGYMIYKMYKEPEPTPKKNDGDKTAPVSTQTENKGEDGTPPAQCRSEY